MRTIRFTSRFKRDYRRETSGRHAKDLKGLLDAIIHQLIADQPLPQRNLDHPLSGNWVDCRDCHVKPDLILIYRKLGADIFELVRLGSHSELGL
jgi:mRNA interferase YafQ